MPLTTFADEQATLTDMAREGRALRRRDAFEIIAASIPSAFLPGQAEVVSEITGDGFDLEVRDADIAAVEDAADDAVSGNGLDASVSVRDLRYGLFRIEAAR